MKKSGLLLGILMMLLSSCVKEAGEGGSSTIVGKIYAYDYNAELTVYRTQYYAPDEDVYIMYGSDTIFSDRTRTNFDGSFRFEYLRPGSYTIFAYSKDLETKLPPVIPVKKTVTIIAEGQIVTVEDIEIVK